MTFGSRSSPASTIAGSPGSSCCSPKTSIDTNSSVGTISARRRPRKLSILSRRPRLRGDGGTSLEAQSLHAHHSVRHRAKAAQLVRVGPQPVAVVEIDDRAILQRIRGHLLVELHALRQVALGPRAIEQLVDLGLAIARVIERLLA